MLVISRDDPRLKGLEKVTPIQKEQGTPVEENTQKPLQGAEQSNDVNIEALPQNPEGASLLEQAVEGFAEGSKALWNGGAKAVNATLDLSASASDFVQQVVTKGWDEAKARDVQSYFNLPTFNDVEGFVPESVEAVTQFGVSLFGMNKATPFLKMAEGLGKGAVWTAEFLNGGLADFIGMKAQEENLTNTLLEEFPALRDVGLEFLANDGKNDALEGRFRNMLEGMGLGMAVDGVVRSLKAVKALRKSNDPKEFAKNVEKEGIDLDELLAEPKKPEEAVGTETAPVETPSVFDKSGATPLEQIQTLVSKVDTGKAKFEALSEADREQVIKNVVEGEGAFDELANNINFRTYAYTSEEGRRLLVSMTNAMAESPQLKRNTKMTFEDVGKQLHEYSEQFGVDLNKLIDGLEDAEQKIYFGVPLRAQAAVLLPAMADDAARLAFKLKDNMNRQTTDVVRFINLFNDIQKLWIADKNVGTAQGRALNFRKYTGGAVEGSSAEVPSEAVDIFKLFEDAPKFSEGEDGLRQFENWCNSQNITPQTIDKAIEAVIACKGHPARMFKQMNLLKSASWGRLATYWFVQNILSSPVTHLWNVTGNFVKLSSRVSEKWLGAPFVEGGIESASRYTAELFHAIKVAGSMAKANWKNTPGGRRISAYDFGGSSKYDDAVNQEIGSRDYIERILKKNDPERELTAPEHIVASALTWMGGIARFNSKVMAFEDDFFKQIEFHASMNASINKALDAKGITDLKKRKQAADKMAKTWFTKDGLVNLKNKEAAEALRFAEYSTYSQDVQNTAVNALIEATRKSPLLKTIMPFIKTVWNVQVDTIEHSPLAYFSKQFKDDIAAGGMRRQEAMGRVSLGVMTASLFYACAESGIITGEYSSNARVREAQKRAGFRPYSIRIGDQWVSYDRLDPFGSLLGICANMTQIIENTPNMTPKKLEDAGSAVIGSIIKSVTDKSFLSSLMDFFDIFSGEAGNTGGKVVEYSVNTLRGFLPGSGLFRWGANVVEDLGQGRSFEKPENLEQRLKNIDHYRLFNSIATQASATPVKYDWLTGESPSHHYIASKAKDDWVLDELAFISETVRRAPLRNIVRGVELNSEQYSRLCELHGTISIGGKTLYEAIKETMESKAYDIERKYRDDSLVGENESYRGRIINRIIDQYREEAKRRLRKEFPELEEKIRDSRIRRRKAQLGESRDAERNTSFSSLLGN